MTFWRRLFQGRSASWSDDRSLVDSPRPQRKQAAAAQTISLTPWSATRLASIFRDLQTNPSNRTIGEARRARKCLSEFWLQAPVDQLEGLYRSPIGQSYRMLLKTDLAGMELVREEEQWRDGLAHKLSRTMNRPEATNLILAAMPYFARGKMRLMNATDVVPIWLMRDYSALFDPGLARLLRKPAGLLGPSGTAARTAAAKRRSAPQPIATRPASPPQMAATGLNKTPLPVMAQRRGNEALALIQNQEFIGRMNGLINLYSIDPADAEVKRELTGLRRQMGQIWLDLNPQQLEALYQSGFGQLYRNFLGCGFSREGLNAEDQQLRNQLAQFVGNMAQPRAINVLLAALPFFTPGKIQFGGGEQFIPAWLMQDIRTINGETTAVR